MAIPLIGSAPRPTNYENLLDDNSANFTASVGSWTATGGAVTRDTAGGNKLGTLLASLKWASAGSTQTLSCPVPGTFVAGKPYDLFLPLKVLESPAGTRSLILALGLQGTDTADTQGSFISGRAPHGNQWAGLWVRWTPTANRTGVTIKLTRTTADSLAETFHIGYARVNRGPTRALAQIATIPGITEPVAHGGLFQGWTARALGGASADEGSTLKLADTALHMTGPYNAAFGKGGLDYYKDGTAYIYAPHVASGPRSTLGLNFEVGIDFVGLMMSERDADTIELHPDYADYDVVLLDGSDPADTRHWSHETADGVRSRLGSWFEQVFRVAGGLTVASNIAPYWQAPYDMRVDEVRVHVGTAPTGAALIVDVNDDGTTVFTTQGNRPSIAAAGTDATSGVADGGAAIAKDSVITVDVDQVGSGVAGSDLYVSIRGRYIW